jgi:hypothetical protein
MVSSFVASSTSSAELVRWTNLTTEVLLKVMERPKSIMTYVICMLVTIYNLLCSINYWTATMFNSKLQYHVRHTSIVLLLHMFVGWSRILSFICWTIEFLFSSWEVVSNNFRWKFIDFSWKHYF